GHAHLDSQWMRPQLLNVIRLDIQHQQEQTERQGDQNYAGQTTFRGEGLDLSQNAETLADDVTNLVENFGKITAGLALHKHAGYKESQIQVRNPVAHRLEGILDGDAKVLLIVNAPELISNRGGHFLGNDVHAGCEGVASPQGTGHQLQCV